MTNAYPLIILGAGASYDSLEDHNQFSAAKQAELKNWKPPLTNDLFDRARFDHILDKYPEARYVDGEASYRIKPDHSLEDLLTDILKNKAPSHPEWYQRLMSFRLYLQELFAEITSKYFDKRNNYYRLISEIETHTAGRACFVNFNYDLLLERNISNIGSTTDVDEYMNGSIKVLKIHGAYNWFRVIGRGHKTDGDFKSGKAQLIYLAKNIFQAEDGDSKIEVQLPRPTIRNEGPDWELYEDAHGGFPDEVKYYIPDIALPIHKKRDFVCPKEHVERFKKHFQSIDRVIIIGWKAADEFLLSILKECLGNRPIIVVSHNSSDEIAKRLKDEYGFRAVPIQQGFSDFLKSGNCAKVLSAENMDVLIQNEDFTSSNRAKII